MMKPLSKPACQVKQKKEGTKPSPCGCPGSLARSIARPLADTQSAPYHQAAPIPSTESRLSQWPVQIKLVPVQAPYFQDARLLIAADCTAFAYGSFHHDFIAGRVTLIGCPKLDMADYSEKLREIIRLNDIKDVTIVRMEVPCCGGIETAVKNALKASGKFIPWQVVTVRTDGSLV